MDSDGIHSLFNATLAFNLTQNCTVRADETPEGSIGGSSVGEQDGVTSSASPSLSAACELLQEVVVRSNDTCQARPDSCQALDCNVADSYRISVTILPCGVAPGVHVEVYHLLEELRLLDRVYTESRLETVYLGEARLFDMEVSLENSSLRDHITLMVIRVFPPMHLPLCTPMHLFLL